MIAALPAALYELTEQAAFRLYVSDSLFASGENKRLTTRFADIIEFNPKAKDNRSGKEIADDVLSRMGF